jgi:hypothetical protein
MKSPKPAAEKRQVFCVTQENWERLDKLDNMWYKFRNLAFLSGKNKIKDLAETHANTVAKPQFTFTK